jgi:8-oxo-dGTP diphosphatase
MTPRVGIAIVVVQEGKVLMGKRKGSIAAGSWAFPGGHLEYGETPIECAARELLEETGLQAVSLKEGSWTNNIIEGTHYVTLFILIDKFTGVPKLLEPDKCEGWSWFSLNDLPKPLFPSLQFFFKGKALKYTEYETDLRASSRQSADKSLSEKGNSERKPAPHATL